MENLKKIIASNLRLQRAKYKISQEKLAELTGISQQFICSIETEKANPSVEVMVKIADALNITLNDLVY
ncbi:MAG: helix-turn-helix transcriptional regulator [Brachyspira sp.]|jgi:bacteriophage CI repressor helix-turn-helix domain|nr:helix-turn-helix transcriptional regulator [Brachyspira sp.]